jgi:DNA-binding PadR family transcriptional regulator
MIDREFFLGFIKIHILYHAAREAIYGADIAGELARHGYSVSPGTLYPTLHRLSQEGYLAREARLVDGRVRKYYRATPKGRRMLEKSRKMVTELVAELMEGE